MSEPEVDVQQLIKELAATRADPFWVMEAVAMAQEEATEAAATRRTCPQLRVAVGGPKEPHRARWRHPFDEALTGAGGLLDAVSR